MRFRVTLDPLVERDIEGSFEWLAKRSLLGAEHWLEALYAARDRLQEYADQCAKAAEANRLKKSYSKRILGHHKVINIASALQ
jgi:plasmid stabilization system protein ParE